MFLSIILICNSDIAPGCIFGENGRKEKKKENQKRLSVFKMKQLTKT